MRAPQEKVAQIARVPVAITVITVGLMISVAGVTRSSAKRRMMYELGRVYNLYMALTFGPVLLWTATAIEWALACGKVIESESPYSRN